MGQPRAVHAHQRVRRVHLPDELADVHVARRVRTSRVAAAAPGSRSTSAGRLPHLPSTDPAARTPDPRSPVPDSATMPAPPRAARTGRQDGRGPWMPARPDAGDSTSRFAPPSPSLPANGLPKASSGDGEGEGAGRRPGVAGSGGVEGPSVA